MFRIAATGIVFIFIFLSSSYGVGPFDNQDSIEVEVKFIHKDTLYILQVDKDAALLFYYIVSGEKIPELSDKELFINIVDAPSQGAPVIDAGYIDTRYGQHEFPFNLSDKYFYLLATDGREFSRVFEYSF